MSHNIPELDHKGLRSFGLTTGAIVIVLFGLLLPWLMDLSWPLWPWIIAVPLWLLAVVQPRWLRPVYHGWMRFGLLASRITTPLILGAVFYLLITPIAVVRRLAGQDAMGRDLDSNIKSYRVKTEKTATHRLERPF